MLSKNSYYNMLKSSNKDIISMMLGFAIIICGQIIVGVFFNNSGWTRLVDGEIIFSSNSNLNAAIIIFVYGIILSYSEFNGAMSIRANRGSFIKLSVAIIIVCSALFPIISMLIDFIFKYIIENMSGFKVRISNFDSLILLKENSTNYNLLSSPVNILVTTLNSFLNVLTFGFIGFLAGAIVYRFRKVTLISIGILSIILFIGSMFSVKGDYSYIELFMINSASYLIENPIITIIIRILIMIISLVGAVFLLKKAPIKDYAHDLL